MTGPFSPVSPGQPFRAYAVEWNKMLELAQERAGRESVRTFQGVNPLEARIKNTTGRDIEERGILGIKNDAMIESGDNLREFLQSNNLIGQIPATGNADLAHRHWAVLKSSAARPDTGIEGDIRTALVGGIVAVRVKLNSTYHDRVTIINGDTFKLETAFHGTGRLIHISGLITDGEAVGPVEDEAGDPFDFENGEPVELEQSAIDDVYWGLVEFPHFDEIEIKAKSDSLIAPGTSGSVTVWQGGFSTGEQETAWLEWGAGTTPILPGEQIWIKWLVDEQIWSIRRDVGTTPSQTFIKIAGGVYPACEEIAESGQCVFQAKLVVYHGGTSSACGTWTEGGDVWATATNQCDPRKAKEGDIYPAHFVSGAFTPPAGAQAPLYAFRATSKQTLDHAFVKITNAGTNCDDIEEDQYCTYEGVLVTYHGDPADACGVWLNGEDVYITSVNRCGTNKAKIGDQYFAALVQEDFDPAGQGTDVRDLYAIRVHTSVPTKQTTKIGRTATTFTPGNSGTVNIWRRGGGGPILTAPLEQETAWLDWMHGSEAVSSGKEVIITWFEDEQVWRITGAECELVGPT